jgi:hypothetical protein
MPPLLLAHRASYDSMGYDNCIPNRPHNFLGAWQSLGFYGKIRESGQCRLEQTEQGTKRHNGWPTARSFWGPIKGTRHRQAMYLSLG